MWACKNGELNIAKTLEVEKADGKIQDVREKNYLQLAAQGGHLSICKWLIEVINMPINSPDEESRTPLDLAKNSGHEDVA